MEICSIKYFLKGDQSGKVYTSHFESIEEMEEFIETSKDGIKILAIIK